MVSWWLSYLAKGPMSDFNSDLGYDLNIGCILALQRLFESNSNNSPSPSHSNLVSDRVYISSGLLLMISWWVPYLPKGCRPDFNNCLGGDSNSGPVLAPQCLFKSDSNNGPSPGYSNLVSDEVYLLKSPIYDLMVVTMTSIVT